VEIMRKLFLHEFVFFADGCHASKTHINKNFKWLKIFHLIYTCIIGVLDVQNPCAKNMNPWNNKFCASSEQTNEVCKFVMLIERWNLNLESLPNWLVFLDNKIRISWVNWANKHQHHKLPIPQFGNGNHVKIMFSWVCMFFTQMSCV